VVAGHLRADRDRPVLVVVLADLTVVELVPEVLDVAGELLVLGRGTASQRTTRCRFGFSSRGSTSSPVATSRCAVVGPRWNTWLRANMLPMSGSIWTGMPCRSSCSAIPRVYQGTARLATSSITSGSSMPA
jgi:hypothetical protein